MSLFPEVKYPEGSCQGTRYDLMIAFVDCEKKLAGLAGGVAVDLFLDPLELRDSQVFYRTSQLNGAFSFP